jgi:ATP-dependent Lon protease
MVTAIISIMTGIPVRKDVAMTGEITLRGRVLPIGGLKEKLLAALRAGIKTVVIPSENVKDLAEIGNEIKSLLEILPASRMDDVLKVALQRMPQPITIDEETPPAGVPPASSEESERVTH